VQRPWHWQERSVYLRIGRPAASLLPPSADEIGRPCPRFVLEVPFSSQASVIPATDPYPPVGDNGIDLCVRAEVCPSTKAAPKLPANFGQALFDNLRRLVGVSASETRVLNEANGSRKSLFL
jgi:hypothetical protein